MPELPEVEIAARNLRRWALGREIVATDAEPTRVLRPGSPAELSSLVGCRLEQVDRVGKHLLLTLVEARGRRRARIGALSHLGMTGKWLLRADGEPPPPYSRLRLSLEDQHVLHYCDMRLFGRFRVVPGARFDEVEEVRALGPDPLEAGIDPARLRDALSRTKRPVKLALMDQALLPGVGNIQASEGLFRAGIDPRRPANGITPEEAERIGRGLLDSFHDTIRDFHAQGGEAGGGDGLVYIEEGAENHFAVYGKKGEPCPRCGGADVGRVRTPTKAKRGAKGEGAARIERAVIGGRSTYFCPRCQR